MEQRRSGRWWLRLAVAGVLLAGAAGAVACGDDDDKAGDTTPAATQAATAAPKDDPAAVAAVETANRNLYANWNAKDKDAFLAGFTDAGLVSVFGEEGQTAADVKADLKFFFGSSPITNVTIGNTKISGLTATTESQFAIFGAYEKGKDSFVKVGDAWKLDSQTDLVVDVPEGVKLVRIDAIEFAFGVDTSAITGNVAFELSNVGKQAHELGIASIPADANIDDLIQQLGAEDAGDEVPDLVFLGGIDAEPGATSNLVFTEPLAPGRYLMACLVPDEAEGENGTPHALKGMYKEFTIK